MAIGTRSYPIERFGDRVDWCISSLDPDESLGADIPNPTELWRTLVKQNRNLGSKKTWDRCVAPSGTYSVPEAILRGIVKIYPDMTTEILSERSFAAFEQRTTAVSQARARWTAATKFISANREVLAQKGKQYHAPVDEVPDFPLIAKKSWLLETPQLITERSALPAFDVYTREDVPDRLEGLNVDYISLLGRLLGRKRQRWNGDSYRILDIAARDGMLDFTFGPTSYFNYVNSLEAIAAELADAMLRSQGNGDIGRLVRRGPPEAIFNFKNRSAFAGVNCILLLKNYYVGVMSDEKRRVSDKFVMHDRPGDAVEARNTIHVVPSGGHQPLAVGFGDDREIAIWRTVVREFCEELFNKEEAAALKRHGEEFFELPEIRPLVEAFFHDDGAAKVYLLGVGLDPVTTKPEILCAIVADWHKASVRKPLKIEDNYEGRAFFKDLTRRNLEQEAIMPKPKALLPAGKACLLLAAEHFDTLMSSI